VIEPRPGRPPPPPSAQDCYKRGGAEAARRCAELEAELDDLYAALPESFIRARNDLTQRLKQAGQIDGAARVKQLRKPTVPVWAVNQLAGALSDEVRALLEAGERLRVAQGGRPPR